MFLVVFGVAKPRFWAETSTWLILGTILGYLPTSAGWFKPGLYDGSYREGLLLQNDGGRLLTVLFQLCPQPRVFCQQHGVKINSQVLSCRAQGNARGCEHREGCEQGDRCL